MFSQSQKEEDEDEDADADADADEGGDGDGDVLYASVTFSQNHQHCIYSKVGAARPRIQEDEKEVVEYSVVGVRGVRAAQT